MKKFWIGIIVAATIVTGCQKREVDNETQSATDNADAEMRYSSVPTIVNQIGLDEEGVEKDALGVCATVNITPSNSSDGYPKTVEVDYGTGCSDMDGRTRSGILNLVFSRPWSEDDVTVSVSFDNFVEGGVEYFGALSLTKSINASSNKVFTITLTDGRLVHSNGDVVEYETTRSIEQTAGITTVDTSDDIYVLTGSAKGVSKAGRAFTTSITEPLKREMSCAYIATGVFELTPDGLATRRVDFGDGTCDNMATVTINENEFEIELP